MPSYELRFLGADNRPVTIKSIECECDAEAFETARKHVEGQAVELWQGDRFIATLEITQGGPATNSGY